MSLQARTRALAQALERSRAQRTLVASPAQDNTPERTASVQVDVRERMAAALARKHVPAQQDAEAEVCNRRAKRKPTSLPAMITFPNMRVTVNCTIIDMSGTGAKLSITAATVAQFGDLEHLPGKMTLVMLTDKMQVECEVRWRSAGKLGVRFLGPPRPMPAYGRR
ncbi:MAG: PilZ domain-containing protein [Hyphomicrobiaceae bacterium]